MTLLEDDLRIGDLAGRTGASVRALRYYEERGLISAERTAGAQRIYPIETVERVQLVRRLLGAGLSSTAIARVLPCVDAPSTTATLDSIALLRAEDERIGRQIDDLLATRRDLAEIIAAAETCHRAETHPA